MNTKHAYHTEGKQFMNINALWGFEDVVWGSLEGLLAG